MKIHEKMIAWNIADTTASACGRRAKHHYGRAATIALALVVLALLVFGRGVVS